MQRSTLIRLALGATVLSSAATGLTTLPAVAGDIGDAAVARIAQIQGAGHLSPLAGKTVSGVRGVVTALSRTGFWIQDSRPADRDPATSEAVFVYTKTAPTVAVADLVEVAGTVTEFRPGGVNTANLTTTEINVGADGVTVVSHGSPLPAPTVIGRGGRVPPAQTIKRGAPGTAGDVETSGAFNPAREGLDFYESLEGMRVQVNGAVAVGPPAHGEIPVLADGGSDASGRTRHGGVAVREKDFNPERIFLAPAVLSGSTPADVNVGDRFTGPAVGVLDYGFGNFKLQLTAKLTRAAGGLARERTAPAGPGELAVATFNVENLAATASKAKFEGVARVLVENLRSPGVVAVEEIQDNNGAKKDGTVAADQTWAKLVETIAAVGGPRYAWRQIDPVDLSDGGEPGGNIRVGFLYRPDLGVEFVDRPGGDSRTAVKVVGRGSKAHLSVSPGRIDPTNAAFTDSRKPLAGEFRYRGKTVFVVANHWNSKGGDEPLFGRRQPPSRPSEVQRVKQATAVGGFVSELLKADPRANVVIAGDLNDFEFSPAVKRLTTAGLLDLPAALPVGDRYTYVFEGNSQVLDHILISKFLALRGYRYDVVHVNAEFHDQVSDHDPQVVRLRLG